MLRSSAAVAQHEAILGLRPTLPRGGRCADSRAQPAYRGAFSVGLLGLSSVLLSICAGGPCRGWLLAPAVRRSWLPAG